MSRRDEAVVLDLLRAARLALEFLGELGQEEFEQDLKTVSSVQHQLMLLGEGVKRLSDGFRARHSEVPWRAMAGMRDNLIHAYDDVDLDQVWLTVKRDLPEFLLALEPVVSEFGP